MKINEVLTEAGVMDTLKAIAQQGMLSGINNVRQTANRLANQRDVQQLADQMTKVWNNLTDKERERLQGAGSDGSIGEQKYKEMLANFVSKNIVGQDLNNIKDTNTKQEIANIIQRVQDNRETPREFAELFRQLIVMGLIARMQAPSSTTTSNDRPVEPEQRAVGNERTAMRELEQALDQLGIRRNMRQQIGGLVNQLGGGQSVKRTGNPAVDAFLMSMGLQLR
jgi:hypothetical protein